MRTNLLNYGLFRGTFNSRLVETPVINDVYMTCLISDNVCALSCKTNKDARQKEVETIYGGYSVAKSCNSNGSSDGFRIEKDLVWLNGGVYISTILFLAIAMAMSTVSAFFGLYNTTKNPVEPLVGIFGLYIWNGCSACSSLLVLLIWGISYGIDITESLAFTQIMISTTEYISVNSSLGFSYWLVLAAMLCNILNGGLLGLRHYLIQKEPPPPVINIEKNSDNTIFLY